MSDTTALALFVIGLAAVALAMVLMWSSMPATAQEANRPTRRPIEVIELTVMPGAYFEQWCDDCNRTHGWVTVYAYEGDNVAATRPIGIVPAVRGDDAQRGGNDD